MKGISFLSRHECFPWFVELYNWIEHIGKFWAKKRCLINVLTPNNPSGSLSLFYLFIPYCILIPPERCEGKRLRRVSSSKHLPTAAVFFFFVFFTPQTLKPAFDGWRRSQNAAVRRSDSSPSSLFWQDAAHTRAKTDPTDVKKKKTHSCAPSQRDPPGIFSQIGAPKGREAGINQPVSGLQTPAAPYHHTQADVLTDW